MAGGVVGYLWGRNAVVGVCGSAESRVGEVGRRQAAVGVGYG